MSAAHTGSTASCHGINLINKNNTGGIFLCFLKQIPYTGSTHAHKHFHKVRTGNTEKGNARFSCLGLFGVLFCAAVVILAAGSLLDALLFRLV